jgi:hypothetical protein
MLGSLSPTALWLYAPVGRIVVRVLAGQNAVPNLFDRLKTALADRRAAEHRGRVRTNADDVHE